MKLAPALIYWADGDITVGALYKSQEHAETQLLSTLEGPPITWIVWPAPIPKDGFYEIESINKSKGEE